MVVLVSAWLKPHSHSHYFPAGAYLGPFWCFSGSSWCTWGLPPQRVQGWLLFLISLFLHRLYIMTRLSWQWICMNSVVVLYPGKSCFALKHSQVLFVQSWSILKMLPIQQKFDFVNEKQVIHPAGQETLFQDCKDVVIPGLDKTNFNHCRAVVASGLRTAVGYCVTPWHTKSIQEMQNSQAGAARAFRVGKALGILFDLCYYK